MSMHNTVNRLHTMTNPMKGGDMPAPAIPALSQRSYTTYAGGLSPSLFRLPEAVCDTPFKARSEARRNPLQRWVSIWIKLRHA